MKRVFLGIFVITLTCPFSWCFEAGVGDETRGRECMDYMYYGEAIRHFEEVLSENPKKKGIRVDLAFSLLGNGEQEKAIQVLEKELALHSDNFDAYILLAYIFFIFNRHEESLKVCQEFDILYTKIISREICQKWPAPLKSVNREVFWSRLRSRKSQYPLDILIAKIYAWKEFYPSSKEEEEESFNKILRKLRKKHPNLGLPHFIMGFLLKKTGPLRESENNFKLALLNGYDRIECYSQLVDLQFLREDWTGGLQLAGKTIEVLGAHPKIFFLMGYACNQLGDGKNAESHFEESIKKAPYFVEARKNLAKMYLCDCRFEKSTPLLKIIIRLDPLDVDARLLRNRSLNQDPGLTKEGRPFLSKDIMDKVELKYTYVFHSDLKNVMITVNQRALSLLRTGCLDYAVATLSRFLDLYGFNAVLHFNLGLLYLDQDNLKAALEYAWRATELDSDYLEPHDLAGNVLFRVEDYKRSLIAYNEVLRIAPDDAQANYNMGLVHCTMGKLDLAERFWRAAIQKDNEAEKAKLNRGSVSDKFVHSMTVRTIPVSFEAHKSLGSLYERLDRKENALREFAAALEFSPNDSECHFHIGKIYYEMGDTEKAVTNLKKCVYLGTKWEKKANDILEKIKENLE